MEYNSNPKVTQLRTKFEKPTIKSRNMKSSSNNALIDELPTKETNSNKPNKPTQMTKTVTPQGLDEISVTIDIGDEDPDPKTSGLLQKQPKKPIKNQLDSKSNVDPTEYIRDSGLSSISDNERSPRPKIPTYHSQTNLTLHPIKLPNEDKPCSNWMSGNIYQRPKPQEPTTKAEMINSSTDTFELDRRRDEDLRLLHEKIDDLECASKIKDREIETNKWIEKEMQKRLQSAGDIFSLKTQLKELQRNLDIQERLNQDLTGDNARLYDDLSQKDRKILELQSEVNNLDKIVASKKYLHESEEKKKLIDDIDNLQAELVNKNHNLLEYQQKCVMQSRELDRKDKEIHFKNVKIDENTTEFTKFQKDMIEMEKNFYQLKEAYKDLERENEMMRRELMRLDDYEMKFPRLEDENVYLKQSLSDLETQYQHMERRNDVSAQMISLLGEIRQAVLEKNRANEERNILADKLRIAESLSKERNSEVKSLEREIDHLKTFINDLESENELYRKFEREVGDMEAELRDSEKARNQLESQLVQLKPKIQRLQVKSLEKDHLITQLVQELKAQIGYLPSDLRKEMSHNETGTNKLRGKDLLDQGLYEDPTSYLTDEPMQEM